MSGHSKWKNIMHKKGKSDTARANVFTKLSREIIIAVKSGGPDPASNSKLYELIGKARDNNMPNDNIDRVIKKASGADDSVIYEHVTYEGYGPSGVAVIVDTTTDNRNRTAGDLRHYFDKYGGNLGQTGCVSFMFDTVGVVVVEADGVDEDALMEAAMDAGADDIRLDDDVYEITASVNDLPPVRAALEAKKYKVLSAEVEKRPQQYVTLKDPEVIEKLEKLLDMLEENDDVQNVWHNYQEEE